MRSMIAIYSSPIAGTEWGRDFLWGLFMTFLIPGDVRSRQALCLGGYFNR